ncbi:polyketide synthase [Aspergillus sclerotialis]|uniref:Polyketide synthase n=1 Tax=Aspergillus sclerotialis TaxID=2070753 RepID=A0A3A2ZXR9_9EURO|nr:polyketide synthase [Aspergillus sclerotialis]
MESSQRSAEPIAIIGSGCRFPGESSSPSKLWQLLCEPRDLQTEIPASRFNPHGFYHPDNLHHGTSNVRHSYLLEEDCRRFDAQFFGIKPAEAHCIDPQHRLLLETVYESIESSGLRLEDLRGSDTAVYVGLMCGDYADMIVRDPESFPLYLSTGTARSIISNRVSYFFDWHGPCMTIDTACSSSLVAVHEAVQALRAGRSRVAVAAGSNLCLAPEPYIAESKLQMLSPTGRCHMWDAKADGYARGDGVAAVVLKTMSAALKDGDHIECIIRETGVNQDGRTKGITMPSATAQTRLIRDTYARAGLDPQKTEDRCQYFEAHGTGTPTGDPLEAEAIRNAFFPSDTECHDCLYVGSIKTVIGHTEGTAGLAGVLKASLALQNRMIPPNLNFDRLNPKIEPFYTNLKIATSAKPWPTVPSGVPRRASVNSFGFGGTNAHAILEAYERPITPQSQEQVTFTPFIFSAPSEGSLSRTLTAFAKYLRETPAVNIRDISWTLHSRRSRFAFSTVISGATIERMLTNLQAKLEGTDPKRPLVVTHQQPRSEHSRVLGVFTGQGAQWATMGRELLKSGMVRGIVKSLDVSLQSLPAEDRPGWTLLNEFTADAATSRIKQAEVSQPMCTAVQIILVQLLRSVGLKFDAVVGHSSGEIAAAYAAGFASAEDAIRIAYYRGLCSQFSQGPNGEKGSMMAVGTSLEDALELCQEPEFNGRITVAAVNSSASVTLSGDSEAIKQAKEVFDEEKKFARILAVDKAYHSHHMKASSERYIRCLQNSRITVCQPPSSAPVWYSSVREGEMTVARAVDLANTYWNDNMVNPVLFSQAVECATAGSGPFTLGIEVGPHPALRGPALQVTQDLLETSLAYTGTLQRGFHDLEAMSECLGYLWQMLPLASVDLAKYDALLSDGPQSQVVKDMPSYPWDHERVFWYESRVWKATRTRIPVHPILGSRCPDGVEQEFRWRNFLSPREVPWLSGHRIQGQMVFPGAGYVSAAMEAANSMAPDEPIRLLELEELVIRQAMVFDNESSSIETLVSLTNIVHKHKNTVLANFSFYSAVGQESTALTLNASGRLIITYDTPSVDVLPVRRPSFVDMVDVPSERFYTSLEPIGYSYTGPFRALSGMKRKLGIATGFVDRKATPELGSLILHPGMLDASIQAVLLAKSFPGDGELWCLQVPKVIHRISINPTLCASYDPTVQTSFQLDAVLTQTGVSDTKGDVDIYSPDGQHTVARMEGVHAVPLEAVSALSDRPFFSGMVWGPSSPDPGTVTFGGKARNDDYELAFVLERVSIFYLRQIHLAFGKDHPARSEGPYVGLLRFASHVSCLVESGNHSYAQRAWAHDTHSIIMRESQRFPENVDLAVMHIIGEHMAKVIDGQSNILEYLTKDNLLSKYYEDALGIAHYSEYLARVVAQIVHRYPHMRIIEIGAGTGMATKKVIGTIDRCFDSYTFTDISSGFFENARGLFSSHQDKMTFKVLDAEKDIVSQGFSEHSYDLLIASFVLHATTKLEHTLHNIRRLLKPGGYLVMLEVTNLEQSRLGYIFGSFPGWWLGADDGRVLSPCVTNGEWDRLLRKTGFSGIDSVTSDVDALPFPASAIVSQAMDQSVQFLRDPLGSSAGVIELKTEILVVGGISDAVRDMRDGILYHLKPWFDRISVVDRLQDLGKTSLPSGIFTLNLSDLDEPVFKNMTSESLAALKLIYERSSYLLWVTEDSRACNIHQNQSLGFGRSMTVEMPQVQSQFLDLDSIDPSSAGAVARAALRFIGVNMSDNPERANSLLWSTEPELAVLNGKEFIPRIKLNRAQNLRYNASRRAIEDDVDLHSRIVTVTANGSTYVVEQGRVSDSSVAPIGQKRVRVDSSSLKTVRLLAGNDLFLVAGTVMTTGEKVIAFAASNSSVVDVPESWIIPNRNSSAQLLQFAAAHALARYIVSSTDKETPLIVTEPDRATASALEFHASRKGLHVIFLTSVENAKQPSWTVFHPQTHIRSLQKTLPDKPAMVLDMGSYTEGSSLALKLRSVLHRSSIFQHLTDLCGDVARHSGEHAAAESIQMISLCQYQDMATIMQVEPAFIPLDDIGRSSVDQFTISFIDWTSTSTVSALVRSIDHYPFLPDDRTYWLVGLTGSLGLSLCQWMIRNGARNVVLTSRNPKIDSTILHELRSSGARVEVYAGDVTNRESLRSVYDRICETLPRIAGVAQGAMVLKDTTIKDMDFKSMYSVLEPKVTGSINLDELFSHSHPLDFMVFFSSATCVTGNMGQSNYAAANMFMTGLAASRKRRGLAGSVINIGAIMGVGYVTRETSEALQRNLLKSGHVWMSEGDFHRTFAEAILAGTSGSDANNEITCGLRIIKDTDEQRPLWSYNPKFQHLVIHEGNLADTDISSKKHMSLRAQLLEARSADQIYEIVQGSFTAKLQIMLGLQDTTGSSIMDKAADDLGIDSLNTVEIRSWFLKELKVDIPVLRILGGSTIEDIIRFALEKLPVELTPNLGVAPAPVTSANSEQKPAIKSATLEPKTTRSSRLDDSTHPIARSRPSENSRNTSPKSLSNGNESYSKFSPTSNAVEVSRGDDTSLSSFSIINTPQFSEDERGLPHEGIPSKATILGPSENTAHSDLRKEPLSFAQSRFWFLRLYLEDQTTFNITCSMKLQGPLSSDRLERAVRAVGERHEALRTCFSAENGEPPMQTVLAHSKLALERKNYSTASDVEDATKEVKHYIYDIEHGRLMRILLLSPSAASATPQTSYLIIGYHHINMDGVSLEVILSDLEKAYRGHSLGTRVLQYPDFAAMQRQERNNESWNEDVAFWKKEFPGIPPVFPLLPLTTVTDRQPLVQYGHHKVQQRLDASLGKQIRQVCQSVKSTPSHFYLAVFTAMLCRLANTQDVCVGMADANRTQIGAADSVGLYLNLLPLRAQYDANMPFSESVRAARKMVYSALAHSKVPFDLLLTELKVPRSPVHNPLFQVFMDYRHNINEKRTFGDCEFEGLDYEMGRTSYDIALDIVDNADGQPLIIMGLQQCLYSAEAAQILLNTFLNMVTTFANDSSTAVGKVSMFAMQDIERSLAVGRGLMMPTKWPATLSHRVDTMAQRFPNKLALKDGSNTQFTFEEMARRSDSIASALLGANVGRKQRVGVFQHPTADWICSMLAIMRIGATYVPLDLRLEMPRLKVICDDSEPTVLLVDNDTKDQVNELACSNMLVINICDLPSYFPIPVVNRAAAEDPAVILYTSGSTGAPKGIALTHENLRVNIEGNQEEFRFWPHDHLLQQIAFSFDFSVWQVFMALANAASLFIAPLSKRGDPMALVSLIITEGITVTGATPSQYSSWFRHGDLSSLKNSKWKTAVSAGEPMTSSMVHDFQNLDKRDLRLFNGYGPTEASMSSNKLQVPYLRSKLKSPDEFMHQGVVLAGKTAPNYSIYIADDALNPVPIGIPGQILIAGPGIAPGYMNNDEQSQIRFQEDRFATAEQRAQGWRRMHLTGDRGRLYPDGQLRIEGRIDGDTQVKLRGYRVDLRDIETAILQSSQGMLKEAVVTLYRENDASPEFLVAYVAFVPEYPVEKHKQSLRELSKSLPLPRYMWPSMILSLDEMPITAHGKLDRKALSARRLPQTEQRFDKPTSNLTETEVQLIELWKAVISKEIVAAHSLDPESDFFAVGGNSMLLVELQRQIKARFDTEIPLVQLFEANTVQKMALLIKPSSDLSRTPTAVPPVSIDWEREIKLPDYLQVPALVPPISKSTKRDGLHVVLTGATGFIGRALLQQLVADPVVAIVHCIAVRSESTRRPPLVTAGKVIVHYGDLTLPRLGLSDAQATAIFNEADVVIHNGADVSFLKTYPTLRRTNVGATIELLQLALPRRVPFHYVSTSAIANLAGTSTFPEVSSASFTPPTDGSQGYLATKWASERILEQVNRKFDLPVWIHRPSSVTGEGSSPLDLMGNLLEFSRKVHAVPVPEKSSWQGYLDFVPVEQVVRDIVCEVSKPADASTLNQVHHIHHLGEQIPLDGIRQFLEKVTGASYRTVPMGDWLKEAQEKGLDALLVEYLSKMDVPDVKVVFPRLLARPKPIPTADRPRDSWFSKGAAMLLAW